MRLPSICKVMITLILSLGAISSMGWDSSNIFPLSDKGRWVYSGVREETRDGVTREIPITMEMKVLRLVTGGGYIAAHMRGNPLDAASSEGGEINPSTYAYYILGDDVYMIVDSADVNSSMVGRYEPKPDDLFMELPLIPGNLTGTIAGEKGWTVEEIKVSVPAIRGTMDGIALTLRTEDRADILTFVPCVGFTSYQFMDYVTGDRVLLKLIEFYIE